MPDPVPRLTPVPFTEAIAWAKARGVVPSSVYYGELQGIARAMAFSIADLSKLDQLQAVHDSLTANLETGESFGQWKKRVADGEIPLDLPPHRIENVFRTNIGGAYARGRYEQQTAVKDAFPWLLYDSINDSRTRPSHAAMDGKVVRQNDPWLTTHRAPNGYQCRCRMIALSDAQAAQFQRADDRRMQDPEFAAARHAAQPDKGWDYDIGAEPTEGLRRAIAQKEQRVDHGLFSAFQSDQRRLTDSIMHIIDVEGFQDVRKALDIVALRRPQWFPSGLQGVHAVANGDFFAAFKDGKLYISSAESAELQFSPTRELISAMTDIRDGHPLSFKQEYAVEVLQHELVHSAYPAVREAKHAYGSDSFEECFVQLFARMRYPELLRMFGAEPRHADAILSDGYAYHKGTRNLVEIVNQVGLVDADIEKILRQEEPRSAFKKMLAHRLGTSEKKAGWLLIHAATKPLGDFRAKLAQLQAYARPQGRE